MGVGVVESAFACREFTPLKHVSGVVEWAAPKLQMSAEAGGRKQ